MVTRLPRQVWQLTAIATALVIGLPAVAVKPAAGAFPGDNGKIAFESSRDGQPEIYVMSADGSGQTRLTTSSASAHAAWSPDGSQIAFMSSRDGNEEIYVMDSDGSNQVRLTTTAAIELQPAWSPDGTQIAFGRDPDGNDETSEIHVMNADGSGQVSLTTGAYEYHPAWSPSGNKIAFVSNRDGSFQIYAMNPDGSGQAPLTTTTAREVDPAWSPDGTRIAFVSNRDGNNEIYVMNANGSGASRLTNHIASDTVPAWSPDGSKITFASNRDGNSEIYVMNADGSGQTRLTIFNATDTSPDWQPVGPSSSGAVDATVTVPGSAACLELDTTSVDFGIAPLGSRLVAGSPQIQFRNCGGVDETVFVRGTDATGPGAAWKLVDFTTCADSGMGVDEYGLALRLTPEFNLQLSDMNQELAFMPTGAINSYDALISTACPGSTGGGTTMSMSIILLATE